MYISEDTSDYNSEKVKNTKNKISDLQTQFLKSIVLMLTLNSLNGNILLDFYTEVLVSSDSFLSCLKHMSFESCLVELHPAFQVSSLPDLRNVRRKSPPMPCPLIYFLLLLLVNGNHDKVYISRHIHMPRPINIP